MLPGYDYQRFVCTGTTDRFDLAGFDTLFLHTLTPVAEDTFSLKL